MGFKRVFLHDGLIYNGLVDPYQTRRGSTSMLRFFFQSCYAGACAISINASSHSAIKNKPIARLSAELGPLEFAELAVPIETPLDAKAGKRQIDFNVRCKPFKDVKKITELNESQFPEQAQAVRSAKGVLGSWWKPGKNVDSDSNAMWIKTYYEVLNESLATQSTGRRPTFTTIWPVASAT